MRTGWIGLIAALGLTGCTTGSTVNQPSTPDSSSAVAKPVAHVGATLTLVGQSGEKVQVTLARLVDPAPPANDFQRPAAGMREIAVELHYKNVGTLEYKTSVYFGLSVVDAASHSYDGDFAGLTAAGPSFPGGGVLTLASGESADGFVAFQVPTAAAVTEVKVGLSGGMFGDTGEWLVP